ncbi:MAG: DUF1016 N-terminal domain-containing protein [Ginsengibacter sp.]
MKKIQIKEKKSGTVKQYVATIKQLKSAILESRYRAAVLVNKEMLALYFGVGKLISEKTKKEKWGAKVMEQISNDLQKELPGLRGFSATNIKRMRVFYEGWETYIIVGSSTINPISPTASDQFNQYFFTISFSHHYELISKTKSLEERLFYMSKIAVEFWSLTTLKYHLTSHLYQQQGSLSNNFNKTISQDDLRAKALQSFKTEYLLDFINIEDPDEEDERLIENEIVRNIKKFMPSRRNDFAFIGNQNLFTHPILV